MTTPDYCAAGANKPNGQYDLAVIGAGSAGFSAAIAAAEAGAYVALIGHGTIGGTCVNTGCVPSKTLIRSVEPVHLAKAAAQFTGIEADGRVRDWRAVIGQKDALVSSLRQTKYVDLLPSYNTIAYIAGRARLTSDGIAVDTAVVNARKVIIATGASPALPAIPGLADVPYLTSTTAL
ncbi:MAG: FAD-dependent oxidoreductase, partial [Alphaproteobacteria bacterium]|nr:FAD-dependent oxidoreductase [Alphaproteobacteria bacterium]